MNKKEDSPGRGNTAKLWLLFSVLLVGLIGIVFLLISLLNPNSGDGGTVSPTGTDELSEPIKVSGGVIGFNPMGGEQKKGIEIRLEIDAPLKSSRGDFILSDIYYTLDGSEPTRENGTKYNPGTPIVLNKAGKHTIKSRLYSRKGSYQGEIFKERYNITPDIEPVAVVPGETVQANTQTLNPNEPITDMGQLDSKTQAQINQKMQRIVLVIPGIESVKEADGSLVNIQLSISGSGQAQLLRISGFAVDPVEKVDEIKSELYKKIRDIQFSPPRAKSGDIVSVNIPITFKKAGKYYDKFIMER